MQQVNIVYLIERCSIGVYARYLSVWMCRGVQEYATVVLQIFVLYVVVFDVRC